MGPIDIIIDAVLGILAGLLIVLLADYFLNRPKRSLDVVSMLRDKLPQQTENINFSFDISLIPKLYENWVSDLKKIGEEKAKTLEALGLARIKGKIVISDLQKIEEFLRYAREVLDMEKPRLIRIDEKTIEVFSRIGIISISFIGMSSELGPQFKFTTTPTRFTRRLAIDQELQNNIFLLAGRVSEVKIEDSRIIIHEVSGGERGVLGYIIAEITEDADPNKVEEYISRIREIPEDEQQAKRMLDEE